MNPFDIALYAGTATFAVFAVGLLFRYNRGAKKLWSITLAAPVVIGALFYGGNLIAAQSVHRDALAATRTVHAEFALSSSSKSEYPDFGNERESWVKHGQLGTTTTANGYDVTMERGADGTFTATLSKGEQKHGQVTMDEAIRYGADQEWAKQYPFVFQSGI